MGKRIIQQARGKGSHTYRVRKKAFKYKLKYPLKLEGEGTVFALITNFSIFWNSLKAYLLCFDFKSLANSLISNFFNSSTVFPRYVNCFFVSSTIFIFFSFPFCLVSINQPFFQGVHFFSQSYFLDFYLFHFQMDDLLHSFSLQMF